nr:hypothetical protein Q903MT_gene3400 [Picea sitchensis]
MGPHIMGASDSDKVVGFFLWQPIQAIALQRSGSGILFLATHTSDSAPTIMGKVSIQPSSSVEASVQCKHGNSKGND